MRRPFYDMTGSGTFLGVGPVKKAENTGPEFSSVHIYTVLHISARK